ncbi:MAG: putative Esterase, partial [Candidatus Eremiobacteraeota bacterium]|nr:putative Esterase [Candidatus Eremiobacteraeota bacterium]
AFKLAPEAKFADYDTGQPTTLQPGPKVFARAILDPATKQVVELDLTTKRLAQDATFTEAAAPLTATKATTQRAPEIVGVPATGKEVAVAFVVSVPPTTPINAQVYISTDASGWNPRAIPMDRIDGIRYRAIRRFASGTKFAFRVTRGSWNSVELGGDGLQAAPHEYYTKEVDAQEARVTVFAWSDDRGNTPQAAQPGAVPSPYNPNPFGNSTFPRPRATPPGGFPTSRPPSQPNHPPR